jgi:hypothetical protein
MPIGFRYWVFGVVVYDKLFFVQKCVALGAVPVEFVDLAGASFSFRDQRERVGG